ncbi:hypothetical protein C8N29_103262 [Agitococcus lubricus]|uniref:Uncharacterized protein n=1 Tax=Agitococcus lubricus TaxID=1077255 RepID=A0A2T5J237_9GAMM|nr:hypothetical protein C8N29_103262 [Agitococcus lubricus]
MESLKNISNSCDEVSNVIKLYYILTMVIWYINDYINFDLYDFFFRGFVIFLLSAFIFLAKIPVSSYVLFKKNRIYIFDLLGLTVFLFSLLDLLS